MKACQQITAVWIILCFLDISIVFSQQSGTSVPNRQNPFSYVAEVPQLSVGHVLPDMEFTMLLDGKTKKQRLSDLKGEVIILDFWATWCGACVKGFPKMDTLQRYFKGKLDVVLVNELQTGDTEAKIRSFFEKREKKTGTKLPLPCIINDSALSKYFPHTSVPHYVWLDKNRKVLAITAGNEISKDIIGAFIKGERPFLHEKKEMSKDHQEKVKNLLDFKLGDKNVIHQSILTGYQDDISGSGALTFNGDKPVGFYIANVSLMALCRIAYWNEFNKYENNKVVIEVKDPSRFKENYSDTQVYHNSYCYAVNTPNESKIHNILKSDLENLFNIRVREESREIKCLIVKGSDVLNKMRSKGDSPKFENDEDNGVNYIRNMPISEVLNIIKPYLQSPIIEMVTENYNIDIDLPSNLFDHDALMKTLERAGFVLTGELRRMDVLVVTDK